MFIRDFSNSKWDKSQDFMWNFSSHSKCKSCLNKCHILIFILYIKIQKNVSLTSITQPTIAALIIRQGYRYIHTFTLWLLDNTATASTTRIFFIQTSLTTMTACPTTKKTMLLLLGLCRWCGCATATRWWSRSATDRFRIVQWLKM